MVYLPNQDTHSSQENYKKNVYSNKINYLHSNPFTTAAI